MKLACVVSCVLRTLVEVGMFGMSFLSKFLSPAEDTQSKFDVKTGWWKDVLRAINYAGTELLECKNPEEECSYFFFKTLRDAWGLSALPDIKNIQCLRTTGTSPDASPISLQLSGNYIFDKVYGNQLFQFRDSGHKFAVVTYLLMNHKEQYLVVPKKYSLTVLLKLAKISRTMMVDIDKPILPPEVIKLMETNTIGMLNKAKQLKEYGVKARRGILIEGPPGNGKSMLCNYISNLAKKYDIRTRVLDTAELAGAVGSGKVSTLFAQEGIIVLDDIDLSFMQRRDQGGGERVAAMLSALDGHDENRTDRVVIITTNEKMNCLDSAFTRPGRIDIRIQLELPDANLRRRYIDSWNKSIISESDREVLVNATKGLSFAHLNHIRSLIVTAKIIDSKIMSVKEAVELCTTARNVETKQSKFGFNLGGE